MTVYELSSVAYDPVVSFPDHAYKLLNHALSDGALKCGYLYHVDSDTIDGNDLETAKQLYVNGLHEDMASCDTFLTANYRVNGYPCIQGARFWLPRKASAGTITAEETILIPSADTDGTIEIYAETLQADAGSATASAVDATRPNISGNFLPSVSFIAKMDLADDAHVQWVLVEVR